jgi:hypothetical protein
MGFLCPDCNRDAINIVSSLELPADSRSDEITLQIITCEHCAFEGIAVYEESRRGALDSESYDHRGYHVPTDALRTLKRAIRQCPANKNRRCACKTHQTLGAKSPSGRWNGLSEIALEKPFVMRH